MGQNTFKIAFEDGTTKTATIDIISPKDVVMFVAGTTDPVNTTAANHQANKSYWRNNKTSFNNLRAGTFILKMNFLAGLEIIIIQTEPRAQIDC